jgi:hypothetical protein
VSSDADHALGGHKKWMKLGGAEEVSGGAGRCHKFWRPARTAAGQARRRRAVQME